MVWHVRQRGETLFPLDPTPIAYVFVAAAVLSWLMTAKSALKLWLTKADDPSFQSNKANRDKWFVRTIAVWFGGFFFLAGTLILLEKNDLLINHSKGIYGPGEVKPVGQKETELCPPSGASPNDENYQYKSVFDISEIGYRQWTFPFFGIMVLVAGFFIMKFVKLSATKRSLGPRAEFVFKVVALVFAVLWISLTSYSTYYDYSTLKEALVSGATQVTTGQVTRFHPMPASGHDMEHFCVGTNYFEYSDFVVTAGFNNTQSHGGPIKEGLLVRIHHVGNRIAKLEVASQ